MTIEFPALPPEAKESLAAAYQEYRISDTTQDTLTDRLVSTAITAIVEADEIDDGPGSWIRPTVQAWQQHLAVELIAHEKLAKRPLSLKDAVEFILQGAEE